MKQNFIYFALLICFTSFFTYVTAQNSPVGWASFGPGVTGGEGGDTVIVTTRNELAAAVGSSDPLVVMVKDTIDLTPWERMRVGSNKSVIGMGYNATIRLGGFEIEGNNVMFQNLLITDSYDGDWAGVTHSTDAITIYGTNVWVDHCDLSACADGLLDIRANNGVAANFITVSYTKFSNHNKVMLIGSSDNETEDRGKLKTTIHHCWFDGTIERGLHQRMPRTRFGDIHIFNNYYEDIASYCSAARIESDLVIESNYYRNSNDPHFRDDLGLGIEDPEIVAHGNFYELITGRKDTFGTAFVPGTFYTYQPDSVVDVPAIAMNNAGRFRAPGNKPPVAVTDTLDLGGTAGIKMVDVTANDTDEDGGSLRIARVIRTASSLSQVRNNLILYAAPHTQNFRDTIWYQLVDSQGGVDTGIVYVFSMLTAINPITSESFDLKIIPNPADSQCWMVATGQIGQHARVSITVTDTQGKMIDRFVEPGAIEKSENEIRCQLHTQGLASGIYMLTLQIDDRVQSELFSVVH